MIRQATLGDREAIEDLVRLHQEVAFRTAWIITRNTEDARDAAQIAMVKAVQSLNRFRPGLPFRPWLLRIVANEAKDIVTSHHRRASQPIEEHLAATLPSGESSPEELFEHRENEATLLEAINQLEQDHRMVIAFRYFLGLSESEMAAALDIPKGTVKSRLSRALMRLRELMSAELAAEQGERHRG